jgi:aminomethyltransferase
MTDSPPVSGARTPLYALNAELGGKFVSFAGYDMPVQFKLGILGEHLHTRTKAGLFDVSHMGQAVLRGLSGGHEAVARAFEALVPGDILGLKPGQTRYTLLLNETGGILDDLMVTRPAEPDGEGCLLLVVNAATKLPDFRHIAGALRGKAELHVLDDAALMALQGPDAARVLARLCPQAPQLRFMHGARLAVAGVPCHVTRSGYTGEDGFEISMAGRHAEGIAKALLAEPEVAPIGLGARDSLRLEAGLCLYGNDITEKTNPVEANLIWAMQKRRREEGGFPGAGIVQRQLTEGPMRKRVGILPEGKTPARAHTEITDFGGRVIGEITSGGFGPSLGAPVAMGYVETAHAAIGTEINLMVRGKALPAKIASMPFVPHRYQR